MEHKFRSEAVRTTRSTNPLIKELDAIQDQEEDEQSVAEGGKLNRFASEVTEIFQKLNYFGIEAEPEEEISTLEETEPTFKEDARPTIESQRPRPTLDQEERKVQISTSQLLDDIYDIHLAQLPFTLLDALKKAEDVKIELLSQLFASKILKVEEILECEENEELAEVERQYLIQINKKRSVVEKYINAILFERIQGEPRFKGLRKVLPSLIEECERQFKVNFQKAMFDNQSQIIRKYNFEFWQEVIEQNFMNNVSERFLQALRDNQQSQSVGRDTYLLPKNFEIKDVKPYLQKFLVNYLLEKCKQLMAETLDEFIREFKSSYEENWIKFVKETFKKMKDCGHSEMDCFPGSKRASETEVSMIADLKEEMQIILNIIIRLPIPREIKNEIPYLRKKVGQLAIDFDLHLQIAVEDLWAAEHFWKNYISIDQYVQQLERCIAGKELQSDKETMLSKLLFVVFNSCIATSYNSCDRFLLKELISEIEPCIRRAVMSDRSVQIGFYLSVFEQEIEVCNILEEEYNLKELPIATPEELDKFQLSLPLQLARRLQLERLSPTNVQSRHVVICISGFLTEDVEKKESCRHMINHFSHSEVFAYNWNSLTVANLFNEGYYEEKKSKGRYFHFLRTGMKQFMWAIEQTRLAGTMLALFLIKTNFAEDRAITLLGHSLGTVIILHCLNVLKHYYKKNDRKKERIGRIIHDLYLWGGAAVLNPNGDEKEVLSNSLVCSMANGRVNNCFSKKDYILKYCFVNRISKYTPIGLIPIFEEIPSQIQDISSPYKKAFNYDVTVEAPGHTWYNEAAGLILERIKLSY